MKLVAPILAAVASASAVAAATPDDQAFVAKVS